LAVPIWSLTAEQSVSIVVEFIVRRYVTFPSSSGVVVADLVISVFTGRVWKCTDLDQCFHLQTTHELSYSEQAFGPSH
jgi:hypothetical protein